MNDQLDLFPSQETNQETNIDDQIHQYVSPKKYWQELIEGEVCRVTPRWGENRLCTILVIVQETFCYVKYADNGKKDFMSLMCLVPVSADELQQEVT